MTKYKNNGSIYKKSGEFISQQSCSIKYLIFKSKGDIMVDTQKCITCGACVSICPVGAIKIVKGKAKIDEKKCVKCGGCASFCPMSAINIKKG